MKKFQLSETKFYQSLTNESLAKSKFIGLHKTYDKPWNVVIFYIVAALCLAFAIIGITLTVLGHNDYTVFIGLQKQIAEQKGLLSDPNLTVIQKEVINKAIEALKGSLPDITMFIYGLFFVVLTIIFMVVLALFGNSTFNKKMHSNI